MRKRYSILGIVILLIVAIAVVQVASAAVKVDTSALREAVTVDGVRAHQAAFQAIADANGGVRTSGTLGYEASVDYVVDTLKEVGYQPIVQTFDYDYFEEISSAFAQTSPDSVTYQNFDFTAGTGDYYVMDYSGSGTVIDTPLAAVNDIIIPFPAAPNTSNSGCEMADFLDGNGASLVTGKVALIQRGTCTFALKAQNAEANGAVGAVIFNEGQADFGRDGVVFGTLGTPGITIPVIGISYALGVELYQTADIRVNLEVEALAETRTTSNVLAETSGRDDRVVVVGAHLDSVSTGPGIQDNGSGSAAILEIALQMAVLGIEPRNQVRFAWWGAEESGLLGAEYYVSQLNARDIKNIALNLNFDMIGSPNFVRFVYDGDGSATPLAGPNGSGNIEQVFLDYFGEQGLATEPTAFDGRSDYGPFIDVGIPAGGLFTGAEDIKTEEQVAIYGGTAGEQYDPCYHLACDTFDNISLEALDQMSDASAHATLTFAMTTSSVNGTDKGKGLGTFSDGMEFQGSLAKQ